MPIQIRLVDGDKESLYQLQEHESVLIVGRHADCDIVLGEQRASRKHFRISRTDDGGWLLTDLGSSNGTVVNGEVVTERRLAIGDKIAVGKSLLIFGQPEPARRVAPPPVAAREPGGREVRAARRELAKKSSLVPFVLAGAGIFVVGLIAIVVMNMSTPTARDAGPAADEDAVVDEGAARERDRQAAVDAFRKTAAKLETDPTGTLAELRKTVELSKNKAYIAELRRMLEEAEESLATLAQRELEEAVAVSRDLRWENRFGDALAALNATAGKYTAAIYQPEKWRPVYDAELRRLQSEAAAFFGSLVREADMLVDGDPELAAQMFRDAIAKRFQGFASRLDECRQRLKIVEMVIEARRRGDAQAERDLIERMRNRRAEEADEQPEPEPVAPPVVEEGDGLDDDMLLMSIHAKFIDACNKENGQDLLDRFIQYRGERRLIRGADVDKGLKVYMARTDLFIPWENITPAMRMVAYQRIADRTAMDFYAMAVLAFRTGEEETARELLFALRARFPNETKRLDAFMARQLDRDVPEGGFIAYDPDRGRGRMITPEEQEAIVIAERVDELLEVLERNIGSTSERRLERVNTAVDELMGFGPLARRRAVDIIIERRDEELEKLQGMGVGDNSMLAKLKVDLDAAREKALEAIFDEQNYPYPKPANGPSGQELVDELVDKVKEIWNDPAAQVPVGDNIVEATNVIDMLIEIGARIDPDGRIAEDEGKAAFREQLRARRNTMLNIQRYTTDPVEQKMYAEYEQIEKDNNLGESEASQAERDHVSIVNAYRIMMGRPAVRINSKLTLAARGHSQYMKSSGQFAHNIPGHPDGESPQQRAAKQGYSAGVGENIAMNGRGHGPESSFTAWYNSSGHHRNMLTARWKVLGAGSAGTHWTQKFGPVTDGSEPKAPAGPQPPGR
jgi:uncharacterized protein YkwD